MNDQYLIANLNVPINQRIPSEERAETVYRGKMEILAAIRDSLFPKAEKEFDTTPVSGRYVTSSEYTLGTI
tara:strand:- start:323 stop:535 length:213 start_codon:yes stop_codon:yes gene_type:complete